MSLIHWLLCTWSCRGARLLIHTRGLISILRYRGGFTVRPNSKSSDCRMCRSLSNLDFVIVIRFLTSDIWSPSVWLSDGSQVYKGQRTSSFLLDLFHSWPAGDVVVAVLLVSLSGSGLLFCGVSGLCPFVIFPCYMSFEIIRMRNFADPSAHPASEVTGAVRVVLSCLLGPCRILARIHQYCLCTRRTEASASVVSYLHQFTRVVGPFYQIWHRTV